MRIMRSDVQALHNGSVIFYDPLDGWIGTLKMMRERDIKECSGENQNVHTCLNIINCIITLQRSLFATILM